MPGLTATKEGCEHGVCGACTVQLDGGAVRSCMMLAVQADGCELRTIEALGAEEHPRSGPSESVMLSSAASAPLAS